MQNTPKRDNRIPVLDYWQTKYDGFRLSTASGEEKSFFETVMLIEGVQYRYGVELNEKEVLSEWLYMKRQREINVFAREGADIKFNKEQVNVKVANNIISANMVSPTSSFLAVLKTFNEQLATKIVGWFDDAVVISANDIRSAVSLQYLADDKRKKVITKFMKAFDFNIEDMNLHEIRLEDVPEKVKPYDSESKAVEEDFFDLMMAIHPETHNQRLVDAYNRAKAIHETKKAQGAEFTESVTTMYELMKELGVVSNR